MAKDPPRKRIDRASSRRGASASGVGETRADDPAYTIRGATPRDFEAIAELTEKVFHDSFFRDVLLPDPSFGFDDARLAFDENGKLVSSVFVSSRRMRYEGALLELAGVGGVATDPDYRGRGYAGAAMKDAIDHMTEKRYDLSLLYPFDSAYYAKFGYGEVVLPFQVLELEGVVERSRGYELRELDPGDIDALSKIYDHFNRSRLGPIERSSLYWERYLAKNKVLREQLLVAERGGEVVAYLILDRIFVEWGRTDYRLKISEVGALDGHAEALLSLSERAAAHAAKAGFERLYFDEVEGFEVPGAHEPSETDIGDYGNVKHVKMIRPVDLQGLFDKLTPVLDARLERSGRSGRWQETFSLRRRQHGYRCPIELALIDSGSTLCLDEDAFAKLLLGLEPLERLKLDGGERLSESERQALAAVFPARKPVYWDFDYL